ncbi:MAG: 16S rRNA (uracil(1498)-N(3))-methyltransferase [Pseudomonas sp.]
MNLLLLHDADFIAEDRVLLRGRRLQHLLEVHQVEPGDSLKVGRLGGMMGQGQVLALSAEQAEIQVLLNQPPPAKLPLTLLLAMPRPKMFRRILQHCATLGVAEIILLNSYRVEKSFWQTPFLQPEHIQHNLLLGLEQARDTLLPTVRIEKRFKPFVEDHLPEIASQTLGLVAHPGPYAACPRAVTRPVTLAIGPEGGWLPYEVEKLVEAGLQPVQLGERILRVETAVTALVGRLF